jgi:hypothetical protein
MGIAGDAKTDHINATMQILMHRLVAVVVVQHSNLAQLYAEVNFRAVFKT